ncbi:MAG: TetR family transcriptional regulator [Candidatus Nanopelagicales bacterium]
MQRTADAVVDTALRLRILDAAAQLTATEGWSAVTMVRLGDLAGVSRQSVYNEVGSKPALAEALVMRELEGFLGAVDAELKTAPTLPTAIERASEAVFVRAADNPLLLAIASSAHGNSSDLLPFLTTNSQALISTASALISQRIRELFPAVGASDDDLTIAVDAIVRLVLSHVMQPNGSPADEAAAIAWIATHLLGS